MNGTKAAQTLATKRKLEQIARELFAERGFVGVSSEELVAKADVTRGALYHHYDGKEGIFEDVVDTVMQEVHAKLVTEMAVFSVSAAGALKRGIGVFLAACSEPSVQRILLVDVPRFLLAQAAETDARYGLGLIKQALSAAMKAGLTGSTGRRRRRASSARGARIEAAIVVARSHIPSNSRKAAERALALVLQSGGSWTDAANARVRRARLQIRGRRGGLAASIGRAAGLPETRRCGERPTLRNFSLPLAGQVQPASPVDDFPLAFRSFLAK